MRVFKIIIGIICFGMLLYSLKTGYAEDGNDIQFISRNVIIDEYFVFNIAITNPFLSIYNPPSNDHLIIDHARMKKLCECIKDNIAFDEIFLPIKEKYKEVDCNVSWPISFKPKNEYKTQSFEYDYDGAVLRRRYIRNGDVDFLRIFDSLDLSDELQKEKIFIDLINHSIIDTFKEEIWKDEDTSEYHTNLIEALEAEYFSTIVTIYDFSMTIDNETCYNTKCHSKIEELIGSKKLKIEIVDALPSESGYWWILLKKESWYVIILVPGGESPIDFDRFHDLSFLLQIERISDEQEKYLDKRINEIFTLTEKKEKEGENNFRSFCEKNVERLGMLVLFYEKALPIARRADYSSYWILGTIKYRYEYLSDKILHQKSNSSILITRYLFEIQEINQEENRDKARLGIIVAIVLALISIVIQFLTWNLSKKSRFTERGRTFISRQPLRRGFDRFQR